MLYHTLFLTTNALIINTHRNVIAPRQSIRQLKYVIYLYNFMLVQKTVNSLEYKL